jgi:hypothetical protein
VTVHTAAGAVQTHVPNVPGNYLGFYAQLCACLSGQDDQPAVNPAQVYLAMQLLTLGEQSAVQRKTLAVMARPGDESAAALQ